MICVSSRQTLTLWQLLMSSYPRLHILMALWGNGLSLAVKHGSIESLAVVQNSAGLLAARPECLRVFLWMTIPRNYLNLNSRRSTQQG